MQKRKFRKFWALMLSTSLIMTFFIGIKIPVSATTIGSGTIINNLVVNDTTRASSWSIQSNLQLSNVVYGDYAATFNQVPPRFLGKEWIKPAKASNSYTSTTTPLLTFSVNCDTDVYIAYHTSISPKASWLSSFAYTGNVIKILNTNSTYTDYMLYKQSFLKDSVVSLGNNGNTGYGNYFVIVDTTNNSAPSMLTGKVEAEDGILNLSKTYGDSYASNGFGVGGLDTVGNSLSFNNCASSDQLTIKYATTKIGHISLYVNDTHTKDIDFTSTGAFSGSASAYQDLIVNNLSIPEGATIKLQEDTGDNYLNVDYITLANTATPTPTPSETPTPNPTDTPTPTPTDTPTPTPSDTPIPTSSPTPAPEQFPPVLTGAGVVENFSSTITFTDGMTFGANGALTISKAGATVLDNASGKYLDVSAANVSDAYLISSTNPLPEQYKISVDVGDINYTQVSGDGGENGMSFITILNAKPGIGATGGHKKVTFDTDDNSDLTGGSLPVFAGYFNPNDATDFGKFYKGSAGTWGSWDSITNYQTDKWYTFELEKTATQYIFTISDALTHTVIKTASFSVSNTDTSTPDYFCMGDALTDYFHGVAKIANIRIADETPPPVDLVDSRITLKDWIEKATDISVKLYGPDNYMADITISDYTYDNTAVKGIIDLEDLTGLVDGTYNLEVTGLGYKTSTTTFSIDHAQTQLQQISFDVTNFIAGDIVDASTSLLGSDGSIDVNDFNTICTYLKPAKPIDSASEVNRACDLNRDGIVDVSDIAYLINNWG